MTCMLLT